jgi:hypothetical protein
MPLGMKMGWWRGWRFWDGDAVDYGIGRCVRKWELGARCCGDEEAEWSVGWWARGRWRGWRG